MIWTGTLIYCNLPSKTLRPNWGDWLFVHELHNFIIIIGWISLYFDDDSIFNERIDILWSVSYFIVDLLYFVFKFDARALCLTLGFANYIIPLLRTLRMNSRVAQCEFSTPFLHVSRKIRKPLLFVLFAIAFTLCRMLYIPVALIIPNRQHGMEWTHWVMVALVAFHGLNCFWYIKILRILINGGKKTKKAE